MTEAVFLTLLGLVFTSFSGMLGCLWWSFNRRLSLELSTIALNCNNNHASNRLRIERIEKEVIEQLPIQMKEITSQLKAIELHLATGYPTRQELKEKLDHIEKLILTRICETQKRKRNASIR